MVHINSKPAAHVGIAPFVTGKSVQGLATSTSVAPPSRLTLILKPSHGCTGGLAGLVFGSAVVLTSPIIALTTQTAR